LQSVVHAGLDLREGMDPELVIRAQRGDGEAFASLAVAAACQLNDLVRISADGSVEPIIVR
jgi:hypothetical protein